MLKTYETPVVVELGSFQADTAAGIGGQAEGWFPIADRS
ncbi:MULTISPECIES: lasso RiPP family leader peptide-containing protein [Brevibacterium]|uniref:Lasso RiPP family leader peptide-containing protein n=1 Tax=Brevibacterium gallinarum TaxID=2762220 RepID=A0ABR8WXG7_9MICO|nr:MULTISPECIES: lasso RiPP family leader peptide-containing protein [Brevibacterium]MBD8021371.1 lasso RiPP family leader peptide-containing protein [Brevibacterium gallinarum]MCT1874336.1 lasso RiPP family leader peptide-containing protein [Brevibacterium luteolum]MCT1891550.1 lasso RiPP family leader peptide-containing protein [Brevibacterium luteolum]MCT1893601.1 lasso RiPP family leader peptide-containing protein [Brevibacterium luteolum]MCT1924881.1 lasso RiPP family leader peptide-conta